MVQTLVFSLIYGPVAVTLGCWLFCAIGAARARQEAEIILILSRDRRRFVRGARRSARVGRPFPRPLSQCAGEPALSPERLSAILP
jgi:hypothetical protein